MAVLKSDRRKRSSGKDSRSWFARRFVGSSNNWLTRRAARSDAQDESKHTPQNTGKRVAIIGGGASGLVSARECLKEGHTVVVFEKKKDCAGTWRIDDVPAELQSMDAMSEGWKDKSAEVHSSMYESVRTILPRELMGYTEFPFDDKFAGTKDPRRFCSHDEVRRYLEAYEAKFNLTTAIQFNTSVVRVEPTDRETQKWDVEVKTAANTSVQEFDAVVIATGHYTKPNVPVIEDIDNFGMPTMHSHLYRKPAPFTDKTVVILGNSLSGSDLAKDIGEVAKEVYLCGREWAAHIDCSEPMGSRRNIQRCCTIEKCTGKGQLLLADGALLQKVDCLIFCTGYQYSFPFLTPADLVSTEDRMVYPLYKHLFHPRHPTLTFTTLPYMVVPFVLAEHQAKLLARVLSGRFVLPPEQEMMDQVNRSIETHKEENKKLEKFHHMPNTHYKYMQELAKMCGDVAPLGEWREKMHQATLAARKMFPDQYKDQELGDIDWHYHALQEFAAVSSATAQP